MNWDAIGAGGEILGAGAVVVSLVYLATQIKQNSKTIKSEALQQAVADRASFGKIIMQADLAHIFRVGIGTYDALTDDEKVQFNGVMLTMITSHMGLLGLYEDGSLDEETFKIYENDLACVMLCPGVRRWWEDTQTPYMAWAEYINGLIFSGDGSKVPYTESYPFYRPTEN